MKQRLLGIFVGVGMVIAGGAVGSAPTEAQAQSYRTERAIARSDIRRTRARRAYRADRAARAYYRGY